MRDIIEELALLVILVVGVSTCGIHYARQTDRMVERYIERQMEVMR